LLSMGAVLLASRCRHVGAGGTTMLDSLNDRARGRGPPFTCPVVESRPGKAEAAGGAGTSWHEASSVQIILQGVPARLRKQSSAKNPDARARVRRRLGCGWRSSWWASTKTRAKFSVGLAGSGR
jgi:hypothetical protein